MRDCSEMLTCPCCHGSFSAFQPFGLVPRPNAQCPGCGALERHRLLALYLRERTNLFDAAIGTLAVLYVAPEAVMQSIIRPLPHVRYVSADLSSPIADERIDITSIPRPDAAFDVIFCNHVLEHVDDDRRAMRELCRVLKPGGWAILQSPMDSSLEATFEDPSVTDPRERERLFGQRDHVRLYGRDYGQRLAEAGFDVTIDRFSSTMPTAIRERSALPEEDIYICRRSDGPGSVCLAA